MGVKCVHQVTLTSTKQNISIKTICNIYSQWKQHTCFIILANDVSYFK